jgi:hypothetical protein
MEIIHYNPHRTWNDSELSIKYKKLKLDYDFPFIDRTRTLPHYLPVIPMSTMQKFDSNFNQTFADICSIQALDILSKNKKVNVLWSGGLDSTVALVALLSHVTNTRQIRILANYNSIIESGYLYDTFFKKFQCTIDTTGGRSSFNEDELYVTGALGNQLFSLGAFDIKYDIEKTTEDYRLHTSDAELDFINPALVKSPRPIETLEDYIWFKTFVFKWDHQRLAMINKWIQPKNVKKCLDIFIGFYYNKLYEQWSIHRKELQHDIKNYSYTSKLPMRLYIRDVLGPEADDYITRKKITHSIFNPYKSSYRYTTSDFRVHYDTSL